MSKFNLLFVMTACAGLAGCNGSTPGSNGNVLSSTLIDSAAIIGAAALAANGNSAGATAVLGSASLAHRANGNQRRSNEYSNAVQQMAQGASSSQSSRSVSDKNSSTTRAKCRPREIVNSNLPLCPGE